MCVCVYTHVTQSEQIKGKKSGQSQLLPTEKEGLISPFALTPSQNNRFFCILQMGEETG